MNQEVEVIKKGFDPSIRSGLWITLTMLAFHGSMPLGQYQCTVVTGAYGQLTDTPEAVADPFEAFNTQGLTVPRESIVSGGP